MTKWQEDYIMLTAFYGITPSVFHKTVIIGQDDRKYIVSFSWHFVDGI